MTRKLNGLWGVSASTAWAVGDNGTVLRFDGAKWAPERTGISRTFHCVWASSASDVWRMGDSALLHKP